MINIIVTGSKGRMGGRITTLIEKSNDLKLVAGIDRGDDLLSAIAGADVIIDFSSAEAAADNASVAVRHKKPIVIGTTGMSPAQEEIIREASRAIPVIRAANMSIGVNILYKLVETAARAMGRKFHVDIVETHHVHKLDKPSGTAKKILDIVLTGSGRNLDKDVFFHEDETSAPRGPDDPEISLRSIRRGEVVGDHAIHFTSSGETLSISHHAAARDIFAEGALTAARWIVGKKPGLYGMDDVLDLK